MPDVMVLIYAHRGDAHAEHEAYASWLTALATGPEPFALSSAVLGGVVRIATNRKVFARPSSHDEVFEFIRGLRERPTARVVAPGPGHWSIFEQLCRESGAMGKLAQDAYHAAVAIEHGCTWVTVDGDFRRFPRLRQRHPLE